MRYVISIVLYNAAGVPEAERRRDTREIIAVVAVLTILSTLRALLSRTG
jgi:hypothetical protein